MKFCSARSCLARSLVALSLSFALGLCICSPLAGATAGSGVLQSETEAPPEVRLVSSTASVAGNGVLIQWRSSFEIDNVGFNVYRVKDGRRTCVNQEIISGSVFIVGEHTPLRGGYSYAYFDKAGTAGAIYYIESISLSGLTKTYDPIAASSSSKVNGIETAITSTVASEEDSSFPKLYPAQENLVSPQGSLQDQWAIAAQPGVKIGIRKDGWYRVTQSQMVSAGFNPVVDIKNLRLFADGVEVAINTSQSIGTFGSGDYIEFYGRRLDTPTTDTRTYYLIAGPTPGKRVGGDLQPATSPAAPAPTVAPTSTQPIAMPPANGGSFWRLLNVFETPVRTNEAGAKVERSDERTNSHAADFPEAGDRAFLSRPSDTSSATAPKARPAVSPNPDAIPKSSVTEAVRNAAAPAAITSRQQSNGLTTTSRMQHRLGRKNRKKIRQRRERNHAESSAGFVPTSFNSISEYKARVVYFSSLLNGDKENFFGRVLGSNPSTLTVDTPNLETAATGTAKLEIALQGARQLATHQIGIELNNVAVGSFLYFNFDHAVQTFDIPISQLINGTNSIKFVTTSGELSLVDYIRITYPHSFRTDSGSLRFGLRGTQSLKVDGFATPLVKLIDYTDPLAVNIRKAASETTASGFAITVPTAPTRSKATRLLYAIPDGQFDQPASITFNQPSTLNSNSNAAAFMIITTNSFASSVAPLVSLRQSQGMIVTNSVIDVEDIYDEFSYGMHGPQAIRDFLSYAASHWATPPRYVVFAGDASLDPRNYTNSAPAGTSFDFVPTKLVDATYNETASDDWLTDFDGDGIADIPVGRLPVRTAAEADLVVSKIVNFAPANVPQAALLVADDPTGYYFNFETANDQVQALLPGSMTVQRVNVRTEGPAQAKADVIAGFNQGRALVNYTGHGNVDVWTGANIFTASDATALTNGNKLSFVVVMDCLNGYFHDPVLLSLSEALIKAPNGGAVAAFASSGLTVPDGQHQMSQQLYTLLYGAQPIAVGDAIKIAKGATTDIDVRRTWIFFGDPAIKIR